MGPKKKRSKNDSVKPVVNAAGTRNQAAIIRKPVTTVDSLPLEMLQHILEFSSSTNTLKTWRLVSKSWNDVCCRILQKESAVPLNVGEGDEDLEKYKDLIMDRQADFPSDWPSPFQNFKILKTSTVTSSLARFVQRSNVKITTFEIVHKQGFDPLIFGSILEKINGELILLKISGNSDSVPFLSLTVGQREGSWRSLKTLILKDTCQAPSKPCPHVEFIRALKRNVKLERIDLFGDFENILRIFEKEDHCWDKLLRLQLECKSPPSNVTSGQIHEFMKWTEEIDFRPLTHLTMWARSVSRPEETAEQYAPYLLPLIQKSSQVVEELRVSFMPLSLLPSLPKLKYLSCALMDGDRIQDITEPQFPSLTSVFCHLNLTQVPTYVNPMQSESNKNVRLFVILWSNSTRAEVKQELLWCILRDHFPNLNNIDIRRSIPSSTLYVIRRRFPGLLSIRLKAITSSELLGTSSVPVLTAKGWPCQVYGNCALLEMTELIHVSLGELVKVSEDIIAACLGKLSKIRSLCFHWNNSLQTSVVSEHLGRIQEVTIVYKDMHQKAELERLSKTMKSLKLVKLP